MNQLQDFNERFNGELLFNKEDYLKKLKNNIGDINFNKIKEKKDFIGDGNAVVVDTLKRMVTGLVGYPITPSTPVAEGMAKAYSDGFVNVYGEKIFYFQPESELGAITFLEAAASQGGRYADNTSSQGLTYKMKNLYSVAGKRLPALMTLQTREVNKSSLSIHNSHTDLYAARGTGWILLMSSNNQEMHYLIPAAYKAIELRQVMLPAIVGGEGFLKSHSVENIKIVSDEFLKYFVGEPNRLYQPDFDNPYLMGTFTDINATMLTQVKQDYALKNAKKYIKATFDLMNDILGTNLDIVENYRTQDAEYIIVMIGAGAETMKEAIDYYRDKGVPVGLVRPVLFYPVCTEEIAYGIQNAKVITVLEKVAKSNDKYLYKDVNEALKFLRKDSEVLHGVYGLGSQNFSLEDCFGIIENMLNQSKLIDFFVGIKGANTIKPVFKEDFKQKEIGMTFIGVAAEGVKTSQETLAKIIAKSGKYVQTSAKYGASRKGGMVVMNARVSDEPIRNCSNVNYVEILAVFNDKYLLDNSLLQFIKGIRDEGYLIINTAKELKKLINQTTDEIREEIEKFRFNVVCIDATHAVMSVLGRNLPGTPILGLINKLVEILPEEQFMSAFQDELKKKFAQKPEIIENNLKLLSVTYNMITCKPKEKNGNGNDVSTKKYENGKKENNFKLPSYSYSKEDELATLELPSILKDKYFEKFVENVLKPLQRGEDVEWEKFLNIVPAKTSIFHNTSLIGTVLPVYNADKCVTCGLCSISCPDNALRVTILKDNEYNNLSDSSKKLFQKLNLKRFTGNDIAGDYYFNINVVTSFCKGCGTCVESCKFGALELKEKDTLSSEDLLSENIFEKDSSEELIDKMKDNKLFQKIMIKYAGQKFLPGGHSLCPGCGEGLIDNFTFTAAEMVRENPDIIEEIHNSLPKSLLNITTELIDFTKENGFHIYTINATGCGEVSCLTNPYNSRVYQAGHYGFGTAASASMGVSFTLNAAFKNKKIDKPTKVITFGGDGAFYDIGNQALNYALSTNLDITFVVYNNEAYMNTGFQKSGASRYGTNRSTAPVGFEIKGKDDFNRELVAQAMTMPGVYVARLSLSNPKYCLKILKEAIAYNGPSLIEFFSPCPTGQGLKTDNLAFEVSRMMVESRAWPFVVRKPFSNVDISANPDYDKIYPEPTEKKSYATFRDIVKIMKQFIGDKATIDKIVELNEKNNIYKWAWWQYLAGVRDKMLSEEEINEIIKGR